ADRDKTQRAAGVGFHLRETTSNLKESEYDRHSTHEKFVEPDHDLALARIPEGDPWRLRRSEYFNAGLDFRYFYMDQTITTTTSNNHLVSSIPMATDLSVSVEPVHRLNFVYESRFLNGPQQGNAAWDYGYEASSQVRSAYVLVDDLPYNSFVMYGLYRP